MFRTKASRARGRALAVACESLEGRSLLSTTALLLNEVVPNPYPVRYPNQYVEISGPANQAIGKVEFVQFDGFGGGTPTGKATFIQDLSSTTFGSGGLVLLNAQLGGQKPIDSGTTVVPEAGFNVGSTSPGLNGGTEFYALINYTNGTALTLNSPYDPNNTGTLTLPAGDTLVDGVSFVYHSTPDSTDRAYAVQQGTTTLPSSDFFLQVTVPGSTTVDKITPDAASRLPQANHQGANGGSGNWDYGYLTPGTYFYDPSNADNLPTNDGALTPGGSNADLVVSFQTTPTYTASGVAGSVSITALAGNAVIPAGGITVTGSEIPGTAVAGTMASGSGDYVNTSLKFSFTNGSTTSPATSTQSIATLASSSSGDFFDVIFGSPTGGAKLLKFPNHVEVDFS